MMAFKGDEMGDKIKGLPTTILIPASMYDLEVLESNIRLEVPIDGKFSEMYPDFDTNKDEFMCVGLLEDNHSVFIDFHTVVDVLFAEAKYPRLDSDTFFSIGAIFIDNDNRKLIISGNILKFVTEEG